MGNPAGGATVSPEYFDEAFTDREKAMLDAIERWGCYIPLVFDPDGDDPSFAYSVGFPYSVGQPEVIVFGLPNELLGSAINETLRQCRDDHLRLCEGLRIGGLLDGFDVIARRVHQSRIEREYLNSAMWHHMGRFGEPLTEVYQLVWPSSVTGLYPWEAGCHPDVISLQPALYEPRLNS